MAPDWLPGIGAGDGDGHLDQRFLPVGNAEHDSPSQASSFTILCWQFRFVPSVTIFQKDRKEKTKDETCILDWDTCVFWRVCWLRHVSIYRLAGIGYRDRCRHCRQRSNIQYTDSQDKGAVLKKKVRPAQRSVTSRG